MNELQAKGKKRGGATAYTKIARNRAEWGIVVDVKDFDAAHTSIVRVFQHKTSPIAFVYASHSTDGKAATEAFELATSDAISAAIDKATAAAGCAEIKRLL